MSKKGDTDIKDAKRTVVDAADIPVRESVTDAVADPPKAKEGQPVVSTADPRDDKGGPSIPPPNRFVKHVICKASGGAEVTLEDGTGHHVSKESMAKHQYHGGDVFKG